MRAAVCRVDRKQNHLDISSFTKKKPKGKRKAIVIGLFVDS